MFSKVQCVKLSGHKRFIFSSPLRPLAPPPGSMDRIIKIIINIPSTIHRTNIQTVHAISKCTAKGALTNYDRQKVDVV